MSAPRGRAASRASLAACLFLLLSACGSPYRGEPLASAPTLTTQAQEDGRVQFDRFCSECHPGGAAGLGPGLSNKPLPGWLIRAQVRIGMGAMPPFPRATIDDAELDAIVVYMLELK